MSENVESGSRLRRGNEKKKKKKHHTRVRPSSPRCDRVRPTRRGTLSGPPPEKPKGGIIFKKAMKKKNTHLCVIAHATIHAAFLYVYVYVYIYYTQPQNRDGLCCARKSLGMFEGTEKEKQGTRQCTWNINLCAARRATIL